MGVRAPWAFRHELPVESDEKLTDRARDGDQSAFGELYRRHRKAADSTAWCLLRSKNDADDVVADAFAGVLSALRNGRGPRDNFRRYLLACVRNGCRVRRTRSVPLQEPSIERLAPVLEEPERYVEANTVARAFAALTPRWQHTLWLTEVEQRPAHEVSERMQLSPNATAALAHRARQAFATAYLAEHVSAVRSRDCVTHAPQLAAYVRGALTSVAQATLEHHLVTCRDCAVAAAELRDVNASLRSIAVPGQLLAAGAATASGSLTAATVGVTGSAATATAAAGVWTAGSGAGMIVKGLVAVLLVAPAIGAEPHVTAMAGASHQGSAASTGRASSEPEQSQSMSEPVVADGSVRPPRGPSVEVEFEPAATDGLIPRHNEIEAVPTPPAPRAVEAGPLPVGEPVVGDGGESAIDGAAEPVIDEDADPVIGGLLEPVLETVIETLQLLQSLVPMVDGLIVDPVVTDLLDVEASGVADAPPLTELFTELQVTDGGSLPEDAASDGSGHTAGPVPSEAPPAIVPLMPSVSSPAVAAPPAGAPDIALSPVALPASTPPVTVDLPPVPILDVAIIDLPPVELPPVELPPVELPPVELSLELPPLDLAGFGIPPLTPPGERPAVD